MHTRFSVSRPELEKKFIFWNRLGLLTGQINCLSSLETRIPIIAHPNNSTAINEVHIPTAPRQFRVRLFRVSGRSVGRSDAVSNASPMLSADVVSLMARQREMMMALFAFSYVRNYSPIQTWPPTAARAECLLIVERLHAQHPFSVGPTQPLMIRISNILLQLRSRTWIRLPATKYSDQIRKSQFAYLGIGPSLHE